MREYTQVYNACAQRGKPYSPQLALSWSRAKETFFTKGAHLNLNLSASLLDGLLAPSNDTAQTKESRPTAAQHSSTSHTGSDIPRPSYPSPSAFTTIKSEVEDMLRESLARFVCGSCGNSGRARGLFGIALGVITLGTHFDLLLPSPRRFLTPRQLLDSHLCSSAFFREKAAAPCVWPLFPYFG